MDFDQEIGWRNFSVDILWNHAIWHFELHSDVNVPFRPYEWEWDCGTFEFNRLRSLIRPANQISHPVSEIESIQFDHSFHGFVWPSQILLGKLKPFAAGACPDSIYYCSRIPPRIIELFPAWCPTYHAVNVNSKWQGIGLFVKVIVIETKQSYTAQNLHHIWPYMIVFIWIWDGENSGQWVPKRFQSLCQLLAFSQPQLRQFTRYTSIIYFSKATSEISS
jgi:hypothetical protein